MSQSETKPDGGTPDADDTDADLLEADPTSDPQREDGTGTAEDDDEGLTPELKAKLDRERANRLERELEEQRQENRRLREEGQRVVQPAARADLDAILDPDVEAEDSAYLKAKAAAKDRTVEGVHAREALRRRAREEVIAERQMIAEIPEHRREIARKYWEKVKASGDYSNFQSVADVDRALAYKETVDENARLKKENDRLKGKRAAPANGTAPAREAPSTVGHVPPAPKDLNKPHTMTREEYRARVKALAESDDPAGERKAREMARMLRSGEIVYSK